MLLMQGIVKGVKCISRTNQDTGEVYDRYFVGISSLRSGGYGDEEDITDIQVSKRFLASGLVEYYRELIGAAVLVPVFPMPFVRRGGDIVVSWFFSDNGHVVEVNKK